MQKRRHPRLVHCLQQQQERRSSVLEISLDSKPIARATYVASLFDDELAASSIECEKMERKYGVRAQTTRKRNVRGYFEHGCQPTED